MIILHSVLLIHCGSEFLRGNKFEDRQSRPMIERCVAMGLVKLPKWMTISVYTGVRYDGLHMLA